MSVELWVADRGYVVGTADFLHAFFSTIAVRAEHGAWGSRFPGLMVALYSGNLPAEMVAQAQVELEAVREALRTCEPLDVVWDASDRSARPPWGDEISPTITSLADYFVTSDGNQLMDVLDRALGEAAAEGVEVRVF
jgi:hypothetical protein